MHTYMYKENRRGEIVLHDLAGLFFPVLSQGLLRGASLEVNFEETQKENRKPSRVKY